MIQQEQLIEQDIEAYLALHERKELLRFITCGSVDDGKSTLIGRLLYETKLIYEDQLAAVTRDSKKVGTQGGELDLALLVDGLQAEREQGITIDVAYRYFSTDKRKFIIADTPGHEQYTRNMATGASTCDLAIILIDARQGVLTQTCRHTFIVSLLGIRHVCVAINKMDLVDYDEEVFNKIASDYRSFATRVGIRDVKFFPVSALRGDNIAEPSAKMPWYKGASLLDHLETVHIGSDRNFQDFRFPVQYVNRPNLNYRGWSGTVASGIVRPGDEVIALPSGTRAVVKRIDTFDGDLQEAFPPQAVTILLDREIDVSRGEMLAHPHNVPTVDREFDAMVVWMSQEPMVPGRPYFFKHTTNMVSGRIDTIRYGVDVNTLDQSPADRLELNQVGRCRVALNRAIAFDPYPQNKATGSFIIIDRMTNVTVGAGMITNVHSSEDQQGGFWEAPPRSGELLQSKDASVTTDEREKRLGQRAVTILLTGLTCAGKSTLAAGLERRLFDAGRAATVLDGENMRKGISRDLGFTARERSENLRRSAEIAKLMNNAGLITIAAFLAPSAEVREKVRNTIGEDRFLEIYVKAPVSVCRERDKSGMYAKADSGEIGDFPGVTFDYEEPTAPDLVLETDKLSVEACLDRIIRLLEEKKVIG